MATTEGDNIWSPDSLDPWQYTAHLLTMAQSLQDALDGIRADSGARIVADQAERDERFPEPIQGNRVWRADLGFTQTYYELYDEESNPGGMTPAQWAKDGFNVDIGALPISDGGTGGTTKAAARTNLGFTSGTANPSGGADGDWYAKIV